MTDQSGEDEGKQEQPRGRWPERLAVVVGTVIAVASFLYMAWWRGLDLYLALPGALLAGVLTMVGLAVAAQLWRGRRVEQAGLTPTGPQVGFEQLTEAVGHVNERTNEHVATINKRLYDLEQAVFKNNGG